MAAVAPAPASAALPMSSPLPEDKHTPLHNANGSEWHPHNTRHLRNADILSTATCSNPGSMHKRIKAKRKNDSIFETLCRAIVNHQLGLSINCILLLTFTHVLFPSLRYSTTHFFTLSYYDATTGLYNQGWDDLKLVALWIIVFTGLRAATMDYVLIPIARMAGTNKKKATVRFAEQAWMLVYYIVFWTLGMYLMYETPYFFNLPALWSDFPTRSMTGLMKWYYLAQFAFWLQQIVVVNIEEKRKDHWQMFTHHIITCALMLFSYGYYQTKVGNTILCLMDAVDLILPTAKLLKYAGYQSLCDITFVVFIATWFVSRHVFYLAVCWSIYVDVPQVMHYGCYNAVTGEKTSEDGGDAILPNVMHAYMNTGDDVCFNEKIHYGFLGLLLALQVLTVIWFGMICRVAYGFIMGKGADDSRSDDEGEDDEMEAEDDMEDHDATGRIRDFATKEPELSYQSPPTPPKEIEVEVDTEDLDFVRRSGPSNRRSQGSSRRSKGRSSGISIPGTASDHKDLLGRIGCDKPT